MPLGLSGAGRVALEHRKPLLAFRLPQPAPQHLEVNSFVESQFACKVAVVHQVCQGHMCCCPFPTNFCLESYDLAAYLLRNY